jgi:hypothetical protein
MTPTRTASLLLALAAALALPGAQCGPTPGLRWLEPGENAHVTLMPLTLVFDMDGAADTGTFEVILNGADVSDAFAFAPQAGRIVATAEGIWGTGLVLPGANTLEVEVYVSGKRRYLPSGFETSGDPYADAVAGFAPGTRAGFGQSALPGVVLGGPRAVDLYNGGLDVLSLGIGGALELEFVDNAIVDGDGVDFTVFENAFMGILPGFLIGPPFSEPAQVSVSQDGIAWFAFPCADHPVLDAPWFPGCAGVTPALADVDDPATPHPSIPSTESFADLVGLSVLTTPPPAGSGGDSYDLADVGLGWARFVRIEATSFDAGLCCLDNAGSDIDAAAAVHSVPGEDLDGNGVPDAVE